MDTISHGGCMGDVLAAGPAIRAYARDHGGKVRLVCYSRRSGPRQPMTHYWTGIISPLFAIQSYIDRVSYSDAPEGLVIDDWRLMQFPQFYNLADRTLDFMLMPHSERDTPWLEVEPNTIAPVVFCRSPRSRNSNFPWLHMLGRYGKDTVFIGTHEDHGLFCQQVGQVKHVPTGNLLDAARIIAGAELMVTNQTSLSWIGEGLKQKMILEVEQTGSNWDCHFDRPGLIYVLHGNEIPPELQ